MGTTLEQDVWRQQQDRTSIGTTGGAGPPGTLAGQDVWGQL
jgi:hypothetical protein